MLGTEEMITKPVLYLYPETTTRISISVDPSQINAACSYPAYRNGWNVLASPDGTLTANGLTYNYLYRETNVDPFWQFKRGFCVGGHVTAKFLEYALEELGLNRKEANEFIIEWLPKMQNNPFNLISFQADNYNTASPIEISPKPDTMLRIFMAWKPVNDPVVIKPQRLSAPERTGFTAVECCGCRIDEPDAPSTFSKVG